MSIEVIDVLEVELRRELFCIRNDYERSGMMCKNGHVRRTRYGNNKTFEIKKMTVHPIL